VKRRTLAVTALAATAALAACSAPAEPDATFPNTPETLAIGAPGQRVELRHESGLTYELTADDDGVRTPVLWDGLWRATAGDEETVVRIGNPAPHGDYRYCWAGTEQGGDRLSGLRPQNVVCAQSTALADGGTPYAEQHEKVRAMLDWLDQGTRAVLRGWYCHLVGEVAASAAVLHAQDVERIVTGNPSHCNFSVIHGAYAAKVVPGGDVGGICSHREDYPMAYDPHMTQCWHGVGMGLARIHRFDIARVDAECARAGDAGWAKNCVEGALNFANNYHLRLEPGEWGPARIDPAWCAGKSAAAHDPRSFSDVCYRIAAKHLLERVDDALAPARRLADGCAGLSDDVRHGCVVAAGSLAGQLIVGYDRPIALVADAADVCAEPVGGFDAGCLERLYSALLLTAQNPKGFPAEEILDLAPESERDSLRAHLDRQAQNTAGISG